ncbi:hypothetical protein [Ekhidna sp.]|uniref:hypothetical protein n=1 Tax=Ekhidna sp. TaxID=2608089 RepID=UPI003C79B720
MKENELEIYYDHYKDTFQYLRKYIDQREKIFLFNIITIFLMIVISQNLAIATTITEDVTASKLGLKSMTIDPNLVSSVLLFVFLSLVIRYYQLNILINRQYKYIHDIENNLSNILTETKILRESKGYLSNYPIVLSIIHWIYSLIIPLVIILTSIIKYVVELEILKENQGSLYLILNTTFTILIVVLSTMYLIWLHFKDFTKQDVKS